ncbi:MAG: hypothetical protein U0990_02625 [Candidatus Nanopelagicales bacterium]|nr:hypothetical protein [Candidatus Nanopelagicales bacterium]MDZ4248966.1 hypothetical protein [Candidatus Nanopelagicales bacterium]
MSTWIAGYILAERYGLSLLPASIDPRWADYLNLRALYGPHPPDRARRVRLPPIGGDQDPAGLGLLDAIVTRYRDERPVFILAYDQHWWDMRPAEEALRNAFWQSPSRSGQAVDNGRLAIHVRRGDIRGLLGTASGDQAWMDGEWFTRVAGRCVEERRSTQHPITEVVVSGQEFDGEIDRGLELLGLPVSWLVSDDPIEAFDSLAGAQVMLGSPSGFSYLAGMVNRGKVLMPDHFWHPLPANEHWTKVDKSGNPGA